MNRLLGLFLLTVVSLSGADLKSDDEVRRDMAGAEFEVWSRAFPSPQIAFRFVGHDPSQGKPKIFEEEFSADGFEEALPDFLTYCEEELQNRGGAPLGVVAVGSVDQKGLLQFLRDRYETLNVEESQNIEQITLIPTRGLQEFDVLLTYPTELSSLENDDDLKKLWVFYLIQAMAENKFKRDVISSQGSWIPQDDAHYLLPALKTVGHARGGDLLLKRFLLSMKALKESGFTESELADSKSHLIKHLRKFHAHNPNQNHFADYYASHLGASISPSDYLQFMENSSQIISEIVMEDVKEMLKVSFKDDRREVTLRYPEGATISLAAIHEDLEKVRSNDVILTHQENSTIVIIEEKNPFLLLPLTAEEQSELRLLIQEVGEKNYLELWNDKSQIEKRGDKLRHIHPLRSLAAMFTDPYTKKCIAEIMNAIFKRPEFVKDYSRRLNQEADKDNIMPYVQGFSVAVKANPEQVRIYVEGRQWEALVKYLLKLSN